MVRNKNSTLESSISALERLIDDPIAIINAHGIIIQINEAFERICGLTKRKFVGSNVWQLCCTSDETEKCYWSKK
jgi:PAS domain S-box-containing protein